MSGHSKSVPMGTTQAALKQVEREYTADMLGKPAQEQTQVEADGNPSQTKEAQNQMAQVHALVEVRNHIEQESGSVEEHNQLGQGSEPAVA